MKNIFIIFLISISIFLLSQIGKEQRKLALMNFPIGTYTREEKKETGPILYLFFVFSLKNCRDNLEVIDALNSLPNGFKVIGLVPYSELKDEKKLRNLTGAKFKIIPFSDKYYKFSPNYTPTIFGVSENGRIYFVLPAVPEEKLFLKDFLWNFYYKAYPLLERDGRR